MGRTVLWGESVLGGGVKPRLKRWRCGGRIMHIRGVELLPKRRGNFVVEGLTKITRGKREKGGLEVVLT